MASWINMINDKKVQLLTMLLINNTAQFFMSDNIDYIRYLDKYTIYISIQIDRSVLNFLYYLNMLPQIIIVLFT